MAIVLRLQLLVVVVVWAVWAVRGAPILSPDFAQCRNITLEYSYGSYRCCPPIPRVIKDWKFQDDQLPMRVRRPAHTLVNHTDYWDKFNRAYALLRALPKDDPRAWENQAWMHCSYCNNALVQRDHTPETVLLIHKSWLFLPWHRWYVYFHERILANLIGDDTFALPFWNFDNQTAAHGHHRANMLPWHYTQQRWGALRDPKRSEFHQPPQMVDIAFDLVVEQGESPYSARELEARNLQTMHRQVAGAAVPEVFFGQRYVQGTPDGLGGGTLEYVPHNSIHDWVGDLAQPDHENMGNFYSAARDPLFYGLHCNLDRLWKEWLKLGGRRHNIDDPDWLDAQFLFFDENGDGVVVNVADALDTDRLRYRYEEVENAWVDLSAPSLGSPILTAAARRSSRARWSEQTVRVWHKVADWTGLGSVFGIGVFPPVDGDLVVEPGWAARHVAAIPLLGPGESGSAQAPVAVVAGEPFHFRVARPRKSLLRRCAEAMWVLPVGEEVLTLHGLTTPRRSTNVLDVFVNLPEADARTPITIAEYAGTFYEIPHTAAGMGRPARGDPDRRVTHFRLAISEVVRQLGVERSSEALVVSIVPRGADKAEPLIIQGVTLQLL